MASPPLVLIVHGSMIRISYPEDLPVAARRDDILAAVRDHQVVVVAGDTGSGKTTQLPKMCLELGRGVDGFIGHTQPRRVAARTVAERLSEELGTPLGTAVGYAVRFADTVGEQTMVKVMTDGILLAELRRDRLLAAYDTIIVDEAHERSLNIDFLLGYLTRLLPRRPDLKVIVTSATIDTARFAAHFDAPVVEVSGRTYPVEVRYRPPDKADDRSGDVNQAIVDAVAELTAEGPGDVLVFLPGERDIRDAAEALRAACAGRLEILPLYARLSAAEQHRVFRPHSGRRVVLATNVAETSLTVPGIASVVDTGLARVSRYNHRTKVQRLPIEAISRASADQRAGRCGRVAPGTCIRLYSEDDYSERPAFTDPEILRTNLASVILQMAAIGLGDVEDFPFMEPPDRRSLADGRMLLEELGALERRGASLRLTRIGRRLAELPLDPRLGRMVVEAERLGCLREVTVIAAALSIQDPRERPADQLSAAEEMHSRFEVAGSDFLGLVRLWDHVAELQASMSGNQFRRRCRSEMLNVLRVREWQDVAGQIRQVYRSRGVTANKEPAPADHVHQALLSGLLSHIGVRDPERGDYLGARSTRWRIGRGSVLARRQPAWAMAGELVETGQTWARTAARMDPAWAEKIGAHLVKRSYSDRWWDRQRGEALTEERVSLYGLPVVAGRTVSLARVDPVEARRIFVQKALVEQDWSLSVTPLVRTAERIGQLRRLEERMRRRDLLAGEEALFRFYDTRVPADVTGARRFDRWWRRVSREDPAALDTPLAVLLDPSAGRVELSDHPDYWVEGELRLRLRYRFDPGAEDDGVTAVVPLVALNRIGEKRFEWHVPGRRVELLTALLRMLPKRTRRSLGAVADVARDVAANVGPDDGGLLEVTAREVSRRAGEPLTPEMWDLEGLPPHLRMRFEIVDDDGRVLGQGRDLEALRCGLSPALRRLLARLAPDLERHGLAEWDFGELPRVVRRGPLIAYPALVDEGSSVGIQLFDTPSAQAHAMWRGTRRLLLSSAPLPLRHLQHRLTNDTKLALARSGTTVGSLLEDCAGAVIDAMIVANGGPAYEAAGFRAMAAALRHELPDRSARLATIAGGVLAASERVTERVDWLERGDRPGALGPALADIRGQIHDLVHPGFVSDTGVERLRDLLRYLHAAARRVERLPGDVRRDRERMAVVGRVNDRYEAIVEQVAAGTAAPGTGGGLSSVRWMIEELRVSLWAQDLGTAERVSEQRVMRAIDRLTG